MPALNVLLMRRSAGDGGTREAPERCGRRGASRGPSPSRGGVAPFACPLERLPDGGNARTATPRVGDHGVRNVRDNAATTGRSPSPLLENEPLLVLSVTCRTAGMAYRLSQELASYSRTPLTASSDRWPVTFTTPALTPASIRDCAVTDDATATRHARQPRGTRMVDPYSNTRPP